MTKAKQTLTVKQVRSALRRPNSQQQTLYGLGLKRIGQERVLEDTPAVRGMIRSVSHLVQIVEA